MESGRDLRGPLAWAPRPTATDSSPPDVGRVGLDAASTRGRQPSLGFRRALERGFVENGRWRTVTEECSLPVPSSSIPISRIASASLGRFA